jgi:hypothetical protein
MSPDASDISVDDASVVPRRPRCRPRAGSAFQAEYRWFETRLPRIRNRHFYEKHGYHQVNEIYRSPRLTLIEYEKT